MKSVSTIKDTLTDQKRPSRDNHRVLRKYIFSIFSLLLVIVLSFFYFRSRLDQIKTIADLKIYYLVMICLLVLSQQLIGAFRLKILASVLKLDLPLKKWFSLYVIGSYLNYIVPNGGSAAIALYIKKKYQFNITKLFCMMVSIYIIGTFSMAIIGITISSVLYFNGSLDNIILPVIFLALLVIILLVIMLPNIGFLKNASEDGNLRNSRYWKRISYIIKCVYEIGRDKKVVFWIVLTDVILLFALSFRYFILFKAFSYDIPLLHCIILSLISYLSMIVKITPAGLGVREATIGVTSKILGHGLDIGLFVATLDRIITMMFLLILGPILKYLILPATEYGHNYYVSDVKNYKSYKTENLI